MRASTNTTPLFDRVISKLGKQLGLLVAALIFVCVLLASYGIDLSAGLF